MRKILLGLVIAGFALIVFVSVRPFTETLSVSPEPPQTDPSEEEVILEPAKDFSVRQGESYKALFVTNNMNETINFSVGHEHRHLSFTPRDDRLAPGRTREVSLNVDPKCPAGDIELTVYLRTEVNGERFGQETVLYFEVTPGDISLKFEDNSIEVLWNGEPAPGGALVTYRLPGEADWRIWGETPRLDAPDHLEPGNHEFEFQARLGEVESTVETFNVNIEEIVAEEDEKEEEPEEKQVAGRSSGSNSNKEEEIEEGTIDWDGGTYTGPLKDGVPHGRGTWTHPDGREYRGDFVEGAIEGTGTMRFPGGEEYRGEFKEGKAHGTGTMTHPRKGSVSGKWIYGSYQDEKDDDSGEWFEN